MVKVKRVSDNSLITNAKKKFNKNTTFHGVEFKKTPKIRRKSIHAALATPLMQKNPKKDRSVNGWTISQENFVNDVTKKKKKSVLANQSVTEVENLVPSAIPKAAEKKVKSISEEHISSNEGNADINASLSTSINVQKKKKHTTVQRTPNKSSNFEQNSLKSTSKKKRSPGLIKNIANKSSAIIEKKEKAKDQVERKLNITNLEQKFNIKVSDVENAIKGVIKFRSENPKLQNQLFKEAVPLFLQVNSVKLPKGHSAILRISLPNRVLTPDDDICLIVPEVKGIKNIEHEKHVEHYEDMLRKKGVTNIKKIMTCHELKTEHETFEQKSRLVDLYDVFLVDGRVCGKVVKKCGKVFYKKRKVPVPVKLHVTKLKEHIDKAMSKVFFSLHLKGDSYIVQFGHDKMDVAELVENVYSIVQYLDEQFPGGFENIRGVHVYTARATSIPIYMSFKDPNEVKTPKVKSRKPEAYKSYTDELTTLPNAEVTVRPSGEVLVKRKNNTKGKRGSSNVKTDKNINKVNRDAENENKGKANKSRKRKQPKEVASGEPVKKKRSGKEGVEQNEIILNKQKVKANSVAEVNVRDKVSYKNKISLDHDNGNLENKNNAANTVIVKKGAIPKMKNKDLAVVNGKKSKAKKKKVDIQI